MAGREAALAHMFAHVIGQLEQAHRVRHMLAALADLLSNRFLRAAEAVDQRLVSFRFLHRIEVGALHVLDDCDLEHFAIVHVADDSGNDSEARPARGAPATLARDDLEHLRLSGIGANEDRLDHALGADRLRQFFQLRFDEGAARLLRVRHDAIDCDL